MAAKSLVLIDNAFPRYREVGGFSGRKHAEFMAFLEAIPDALTVCPPQSFTRQRDANAFAIDRDRLLQATPWLTEDKVTFCEDLSALRAGLAYCVFPSYAHRLLKTFEANAIAFTFTIYPGGGFLMWGAEAPKSDARLQALFRSKMFAGVFVHHAIIRRYLRERHGLTDKLIYDKGGFSQMDPAEILPKTYYGFDRDRVNICFVANRYDPVGRGKGYDIFIEAAKRLAAHANQCHFHVVGDWSAELIDVAAVRERITFHGYLTPPHLAGLFAQMDMIVSPTRIDVPVEGKFDGFPLVIDAAMCGVAMVVTDPLDQNEDFIDGDDILIVTADPDDVVARIRPYLAAPDALRALSRRGQQKVSALRNKHAKLAAKARTLMAIRDARSG